MKNVKKKYRMKEVKKKYLFMDRDIELHITKEAPAENCMGCYEYNPGIVSVMNDLSDYNFMKTTVHEFEHAGLAEIGGDEIFRNEVAVEGLAHIQCSFMINCLGITPKKFRRMLLKKGL